MSRDIQVFLASLKDLFWTSSIYCFTLIIKFRNKHWLNIEFRNKEFLTTILSPKQDYYFKCLIIEISIKTFYLFDENLFKLQRQFSNIREHLETRKMENTSHNSSTSKYYYSFWYMVLVSLVFLKFFIVVTVIHIVLNPTFFI